MFVVSLPRRPRGYYVKSPTGYRAVNSRDRPWTELPAYDIVPNHFDTCPFSTFNHKYIISQASSQTDRPGSRLG